MLDYSQDIGVAGALVKALLYYAKATNNATIQAQQRINGSGTCGSCPLSYVPRSAARKT